MFLGEFVNCEWQKQNDKNPQKSRSHYEGLLKEHNLPLTDENVFIAASCGVKGIAFLEGKGKIGVRYKEKVAEQKKQDSSAYQVKIDGEMYQVEIQGETAIVNGESYKVSDFEPLVKLMETKTETKTKTVGQKEIITAKMPGTVSQILVKEGDKVSKGQNLCVLEVMKMETFIQAAKDGTVTKIFVQTGSQVETNNALIEVA